MSMFTQIRKWRELVRQAQSEIRQAQAENPQPQPEIPLSEIRQARSMIPSFGTPNVGRIAITTTQPVAHVVLPYAPLLGSRPRGIPPPDDHPRVDLDHSHALALYALLLSCADLELSDNIRLGLFVLAAYAVVHG